MNFDFVDRSCLGPSPSEAEHALSSLGRDCIVVCSFGSRTVVFDFSAGFPVELGVVAGLLFVKSSACDAPVRVRACRPCVLP